MVGRLSRPGAPGGSGRDDGLPVARDKHAAARCGQSGQPCPCGRLPIHGLPGSGHGDQWPGLPGRGRGRHGDRQRDRPGRADADRPPADSRRQQGNCRGRRVRLPGRGSRGAASG
ncbi:MAG: hypothetical protein WBF31_08230 [Anaerolineae bacterium]